MREGSALSISTTIVRQGLELAVSAGDFDNPQLKRGFELQTGGSGGQPRPILVDFRLPAYDGMHVALEQRANEGGERISASR